MLCVAAATTLGLVAASGLWDRTPAQAYGSYRSEVISHYGAAGSNIDSCGLCHNDFNGGGPLNAYGAAFAAQPNHSGSGAIAAAIAIEGLDSDGDGTTNLAEINARTMPGFSCSTYTQAVNAPAGLVNYVDPNQPGCGTAAPA